MKRTHRPCSQYEQAQINKMIHEMYELYGRGLDFDECWGDSWIAYMEVRHEIKEIYNNGELWVLARERIRETLDRRRSVRNEKIRLESKLSLDMAFEGFNEPIRTMIPACKADFVNGLCLWMYIETLGEQKAYISRQLYYGEEDFDIMMKMRMENEKYYELKRQLREDFEKYIEN